MSQDQEFFELFQSILQKGNHLSQFFRMNPEDSFHSFQRFLEVSEDFQAFLGAFPDNPEEISKFQTAYFQDAIGLLQDQYMSFLENKPLPISDTRFMGEEWVNHPFFNMLSQHYLLAGAHIESIIEHLHFANPKMGKKIQFLTKQYLNAISPSNFLQTNPKLMAETIQSHGKNLLKGFKNFLTDLESGSPQLVMKMTDTKAFKVGKNLATTKGKVIFQNDMIELIQYSPKTEKTYDVPLLIIPPWINKYYILDLSPNNSFVAWLLRQGITVFMISWVNPNASYAKKSLYDYLEGGPMAAISCIQEQLNVKKINALGFCIGGTLLACLLAYYRAHKTMPIKSATFLASLIDFSDAGDISVFIDEHQIRKLEEQMELTGYLDGKFMANTFNSLRANDLIWSFFVKHYLEGKDPVPFDILYWNGDTTNLPHKMHSQYLRWMYLHNDLIKPDKIRLNRTPINIEKIDIPTFFVSTKKDHIAPWQTTYKGFAKMKGEKEFVLGGSGHIAGIINPPANHKYNYFTNPKFAKNPETWLKNATSHEGSWWPYWIKWLQKNSGQKHKAPSPKNGIYPPLRDAPGEYVHQKNDGLT